MIATAKTTATATTKTITVRPSDYIPATAVMTRNGWDNHIARVPSGAYRIVRDHNPIWTIQDESEAAGDVDGTYYYIERKKAIGLL